MLMAKASGLFQEVSIKYFNVELDKYRALKWRHRWT